MGWHRPCPRCPISEPACAWSSISDADYVRARSWQHLLIRSDFAAAAEECNVNLPGVVGREAEEEGADNLALLEGFRLSGCHGSRRGPLNRRALHVPKEDLKGSGGVKFLELLVSKYDAINAYYIDPWLNTCIQT